MAVTKNSCDSCSKFDMYHTNSMYFKEYLFMNTLRNTHYKAFLPDIIL